MSQNSSKQAAPRPVTSGARAGSHKVSLTRAAHAGTADPGAKAHVAATPTRWSRLLIYPAWVLVSFFAAQFLTIGAVWLLQAFGGPRVFGGLNQTVVELVLAVVIYTLSLVIAFGVPYLVRQHNVSLETLGLARLPSWTDIGMAPLAFVAYALSIAGVLYVVTTLIPGFPIDQDQDVGFRSMGSHFDYLIGFTALVVLAPIAEEVLFRGYLYGRLRMRVPRWAAILAVSALFGAVHGQWNVIIDTFVLSIYMCLLRDLTGSIWAGVLLHMIKNAIAFNLLFVAPIMSM